MERAERLIPPVDVSAGNKLGVTCQSRKSLFIAGCGRSGTSCLGGIFQRAGYYQGDLLYPGRESNPKGFFENKEINDLNEQIIVSSVLRSMGETLARQVLESYCPGQLWLARLPDSMKFDADDAVKRAIRKLVGKAPFCLKDPRFSLTAEAWLAEAPHALVLCVFRHPATTAESILKECRTAPYLRNFRISVKDAFSVWRQMYRRLLRFYRDRGNVLFIRYEDFFDADRLAQLEALVDVKLDKEFPERRYARSQPVFVTDAETRAVYETLMAISADDFGAGRQAKIGLVDVLEAELAKVPVCYPERWDFPSVRGLPGNELSRQDAPQGCGAREISFEMLPLQSPEHMESFADNFGSGWLNPVTGQLRLQFQLVSLFRDAEIQKLWLADSTRVLRLADLNPTRGKSPYVGQRYTDIPWSAKSRFILDESIPLAYDGTTIALMADVGDRTERIGTLHVDKWSVIS